MARRLVQAGVTYVEVALGGWDTHADAFNALSGRLLPDLDKGMGALVADLAAERAPGKDDGRLDGRVRPDAPRSTRTAAETTGREAGRSSWAAAGMKGGQAIGATDKDGVDIIDQPVGVMDLVASMSKGMGIDQATSYTTPRGRPIKVVDGGTPIPQLFA